MRSQYIAQSGTITLTAASTAASDFTISNIPFRIWKITINGNYHGPTSDNFKTGGTYVAYINWDGTVMQVAQGGTLSYAITVTQSDTSSQVVFDVSQATQTSGNSSLTTTVMVTFESVEK